MEYYQEERSGKLRRAVRWIVDVIVAMALAWFVVYCFGWQVKIAGHSMKPLLEADEVVLVNRLAYDLGSPRRFDVVVFMRDDSQPNVKRVIGLPGETIQIKNGKVWVDDLILEAEDGLADVSLAGMAEVPIRLGADEYFLLGDNRDSSEDSRFSNIGNVKRRQIQGKVWLRIKPLMKLGLVRSGS